MSRHHSKVDRHIIFFGQNFVPPFVNFCFRRRCMSELEGSLVPIAMGGSATQNSKNILCASSVLSGAFQVKGYYKIGWARSRVSIQG